MAIEALYPLIEFNIRNIKRKIIESLTDQLNVVIFQQLKVTVKFYQMKTELYICYYQKCIRDSYVKNINRDYSELEKYLGELGER